MSIKPVMSDLQIISAGVQHENLVLIELSDGRTLTFSLQKLLTLVPDDVISYSTENTDERID